MVRHPENPAGVSLPDHLRKRGERAQATRGDVPGDGAPSSDDRQAARDFLVFWDHESAKFHKALPGGAPPPLPHAKSRPPSSRGSGSIRGDEIRICTWGLGQDLYWGAVPQYRS